MNQERKNRAREKTITGMAGVLWVAGLLAAGSDNPYMPWTNLLGLGVFSLATHLMKRQLCRADKEEILAQPALQPCVVHEKRCAASPGLGHIDFAPGSSSSPETLVC
ncbi:MAG TPA: hypothetical protein VJ936_08295 [Desulfobacteraceae bacterium]|nr:hypothetical protein [Desulfobacteraceae bacterium]